MKKKKVVLMLLMLLIFLFGCSEKQNEIQETQNKELIFLEKTKEYVDPSLIFESAIDKKYYLIKISNWQYDNVAYQKGDIIEIESIKAKEMDVFSQSLKKAVMPKGTTFPEENVYIFDDWRNLFILEDYTKID